MKQLSPSPEAVASLLGIDVTEVRGKLKQTRARQRRWFGTRLILTPADPKASSTLLAG